MHYCTGMGTNHDYRVLRKAAGDRRRAPKGYISYYATRRGGNYGNRIARLAAKNAIRLGVE
jgi:hypothetical protein